MKITENDIGRLASFPEQNPNPVMEINIETGEITYMNPACVKRFPKLTVQKSEHPLFAQIKKKLHLKKDFQSEIIIDKYIFEQKIYFIPESSLIRIYSNDITERVLIQKNLSRLASFPEQNPSPIIEVDIEKNITYLNPACIIHFPEISFLKFDHQALHNLNKNFKKFKTGELIKYEEEIKIGNRYYAQRMLLMAEMGVIRIFNIDITQIKEAEGIIREKNKDITDSIIYAKKIQESILPQLNILHTQFSNSFVFYQPKDIVSGDFYWFTLAGDSKQTTNETQLPYLIIAAADCTGHGVPGAFMSMVGTNLLSHIVLEGEIKKPSDALTELDRRIKKALKQEDEQTESRDGMDIALCSINKEKHILHYAGANRPLLIIRDRKLIEYTPTKLPIGGRHTEDKFFQNHTIELCKGDCIYMFTDGYCDQFGGPNGKKFMKKKFYELLLNVSSENMQKQKNIIDEAINNWKGLMEQTDDMLVIGIKYD